MNKRNAAIDLVNAYLKLHTAADTFAEQTGCSVITHDYIHLLSSGDNRKLVESLGVDLKIGKIYEGYRQFSFTYQCVEFLWLETADNKEE